MPQNSYVGLSYNNFSILHKKHGNFEGLGSVLACQLLEALGVAHTSSMNKQVDYAWLIDCLVGAKVTWHAE